MGNNVIKFKGVLICTRPIGDGIDIAAHAFVSPPHRLAKTYGDVSAGRRGGIARVRGVSWLSTAS